MNKIIFALLFILFCSTKANAQILKYKFYAGKAEVYFLTDNIPNSTYLVGSLIESKKAFIADKCGIGIIKLRNTEMGGDGPYYLDGVELPGLADTFQEGLPPKYKCNEQIKSIQNAGYYQRIPNKSGNNYTFFISNLQPNQAYNFSYIEVKRIYPKIDFCGIGRFNPNALGAYFRMDSIENGITKVSEIYYKADLPALSAPPICRNNKLFLPIFQHL